MHSLQRFVKLLSLSAFAAGSVFAVDVASCNSTCTVCSVRENVLLQLSSGCEAIAGDVVVQDQSSSNVSDVFRVFNNIVDTGAGTGFGNLVILYSANDSTPLPAPSTYSANFVTIKEAASGGTSYTGNGTTYNLDTSAAVTSLVYTGDTTADYHDPAQLTAVLKVVSSGSALPNASVQFTLGSQSCNATTNASGVATCSAVLSQVAGNYTVTASFSGIFGADAGTSVSRPFVITLEQTTLSYTGDTVIANGATAHMSGILLEDGVTPIAGRTVKFALGTGGTAQTCNGITDATGKAVCTISPVAQPVGPGIVSDGFAGDAFYLPATASTNTVGFAFLSQGGFVIGNLNDQNGGSVTFWGSQWASNNTLSSGTAPDSFKGFADILSTEPPTCGITWASGPGSSSHPPDTVPAYMGVLVSSSVTQSGSTLLGGAIGIAVVKTDPGYAGNPGHAGTGTVVAQFCP
jgi:hypothetical protein